MPGNFHVEKKKRDSDDEDEGMDNFRAQPDDLVKPPGIEPFGDSPPFGILCGLFEQFENATRNKHKKPGHKGDLLKEFFETWRRQVGPDLYPLVRLLLPDRDNRRRTYQLKEQKLAKAIIGALQLPPKNDSAIKLMNWKLPTKDDPSAGEFATVAYEVIKTRSTVLTSSKEVSIDFVNDMLDQLSRSATAKEPNGQKRSLHKEHVRLITQCIQKLTPQEMKWLIRIILRDLKIGMGEQTIFKQLHIDAVAVFNTCSDIKRVCWRLHNPLERIVREDWTITPGSVFRPMLAWRAKLLDDIVRAMRKSRQRHGPEYEFAMGEYKDDEFIMEEKLDGERIQMHKIGDSNDKNYTHLYGSSPVVGSLTPFLKDAFLPEIEDLILDGEMLVWDPKLVKYMPFGSLKTFAKMRTENIHKGDPRPCFKVFDILYVKGKNGKPTPLLENALWDRKRLLAKILTPKKGVIEIADFTTGRNKDDIRDFLGRILEERRGLVIKHPTSMYALGQRQQAWIKIKPDYMDSLGENIEAVVIGGYWGEGRRGGILASYLVGLRGKHQNNDVVFSFAKVGSGISRQAYSQIDENYADRWYTANRSSPPSWFVTVNEWPDMFIEPDQSFVLEVKAAEIVPGVDYGAGMTLRFPRCSKVRHDKAWDDGMDLETVRTFRSGPQKRQMTGELSSRRQTSSRGNASKKARTISAPSGTVQVNSDLFKGLLFYIHTTTPISLKTELQKQVKEYGGDYQQGIPPAELRRVIVAQKFEGIKSKKGAKDADIVKPEWVTDSIEQRRLMPLHKRYLVNATDATKAKPEYEGEENADEMMEDGVDEDRAFGGTPSASAPPTMAYREPREDRGEEALDDEDEPETEGESLSDEDEDDGQDDEDDEWDKVIHQDAQVSVTGILEGIKLDPAAVKEADLAESQGSIRAAVGDIELDPESQVTVRAGLDDVKLEPDSQMSAIHEDGPMDRTFSRFVAYFDTQANAELNSLLVSKKSAPVQKQADKKLDEAKEAFIANGGLATSDLLDPLLTHLIVTDLVPERYKELINRTSQPAYRRIVTVDWITESVDEGTALDEPDYKP
ncbi:DNA ligase (ATP) [Rhodosporidiobolus nylandii]